MARDTNFYYSFLVLPPEKRRAIVAVWDFCRAVDDAVDEPQGDGPAAETLAFWRAELSRVAAGTDPQTPQGRTLLPVVRRFNLPEEPFAQLIDGVAMDVGSRRYRTFDELREYCYRVASTVGLIAIEIFGYTRPEAREYAVQLGLALQLTNILRDIPADLARGRLYVPLDDLDAFGCTEADLASGCLDDRTRALLRHQAARARLHYERARGMLPRQDARRLVPAEIMAAIYREILRRIEARRYDVFSRVIRVPRPQRAAIAAITWARVLAGAW